MKLINYLLGVLTSSAVLAFCQFLITRRDNKKNKYSEIESRLDKIEAALVKNEKDNVRTQMLLVMSDYPQEEKELMTLAEHYFCDLHGNWYMTSIFKNYCARNNIPIPEWMPNKE